MIKVPEGQTCGCGRIYTPGAEMGSGSLCPFGDCRGWWDEGDDDA